ncbi:MAG: GGDEF domain-containing protein [Alphaproteobacteria bacterium]|nr:GGDEF domain-containing protein [Alphaproteobacteria bacterium]
MNKPTDKKDPNAKTVATDISMPFMYSESLEKVQEIAVNALERIEVLGLRPVPEMYELWYRYFQGDVEIVRAIEAFHGKIDEIACHQIYRRYMNEAVRDEAVKKISDQMQSAIAELASMVSTAKSATTEYGENLSDVSQQIGSASSLEDLGAIVSAIVADTRKMVEKNQELEVQLGNSSQQVTELRNNLDTVKKEAMTDGLTGLLNRKAFDQQMLDCVSESEKTETPMVLMLLDIDFFKKFNDTYGHQVGDQVLRLVARTLTDNVKGRDFAARYGGEEFAIILPDTPVSAGLRVAEILRKSVESKEVINKASNENMGRITLSIGVAEYTPGEPIADLIERADKALYDAKRAGRNRVIEAASAPREE